MTARKPSLLRYKLILHQTSVLIRRVDMLIPLQRSQSGLTGLTDFLRLKPKSSSLYLSIINPYAPLLSMSYCGVVVRDQVFSVQAA